MDSSEPGPTDDALPWSAPRQAELALLAPPAREDALLVPARMVNEKQTTKTLKGALIHG